MSEAKRIADQLRRAFEGGAWHGPAVQEILQGVTAAQAARRPVAGAHTIWELVHHITAWATLVRRRLEGETIVDVPHKQDWPPVTDTNAAAWKRALKNLKDSQRRLGRTIAGLSDAQLKKKVPGKKHTLYVEAHGVIQHDLYHAGQIALLKKALSKR
jgi:uncharacterized damage-inducible protein DinB